MTLRLNGSTSGYTEIDAPAVAGSNTLVLPGGNGSDAQVLSTNGSGALSWVDRGRMVLETAKTATGTAVDFTDIPSWVKRITVMLNGVSTNGTSFPLIQVGDSGGVETSGYSGALSSFKDVATPVRVVTFSTGFNIAASTLHDFAATTVLHGQAVLLKINGNDWSFSANLAFSSTNVVQSGAGSKSLSSTLDRVRITTVNGTDTFDAGSINILYEG